MLLNIFSKLNIFLLTNYYTFLTEIRDNQTNVMDIIAPQRGSVYLDPYFTVTVYIIKVDTIIFSPAFNEQINQKLLVGYKKIIFSDYVLNVRLFDAYENNDFINLKYFGSKFNQSLETSLENLTSLTHLTFGNNYNLSLGNSLKNLTSLTYLTFGYKFNQPLKNSLNNSTSLTHLTFGYWFNQSLGNSLNNCV